MPSAPDAIAALKAGFGGVKDRASLDHASIGVPAADLLAVLGALKKDHGFDMLADVSGVDWSPGVSPRFSVVYHVFSTTAHDYIRVSADCPDDANPQVPSAASIWPGADWHEREAYDMFGITFAGHPDMRRILMWDGYPYFPLRKDFPLAGIETELPDSEVTAETKVGAIAAPMAGGPFVASSGELNLTDAEPRAKDESWSERRPKPQA
ncbi:MAG TPA: NADH-quinone oxidoreductase subunit C [Opitutaceae bacterium]|jgi:NADH-quinone oxidoreductase subunit C|nr:NADH-quinone oxidoreductase subunit C [Opitutaceae bacterium]